MKPTRLLRSQVKKMPEAHTSSSHPLQQAAQPETSSTQTAGRQDHALDLETNVFGMWIFLAGEIMFFGALFAAYIIYRLMYPEVFAASSRHLDALIGSINTAILLTSSFTMALAVNAAQSGKRRSLVTFLLATLFLGAIFVGLKVYDYLHIIEEGLFPALSIIDQSGSSHPERLFFSLYFTMTGLHALHMLIGILLLAILAFMAWRGLFTPKNYVPVELVGLFWHFVDVVWIFLFPLLYLIDRT